MNKKNGQVSGDRMQKQQFDTKTLRRLLSYMKDYKGQLIFVVVCILLSAIASAASALFLQHGSFHAVHGEQAHPHSEQDQRPRDEQHQFILCGQDHRSSQGWLPRARARLAGSPHSGVLCLASFSLGRNTRRASGKETPSLSLPRFPKPHSPAPGKGGIQKHKPGTHWNLLPLHTSVKRRWFPVRRLGIPPLPLPPVHCREA